MRRHRNNHSENESRKVPTKHRAVRACLACAESKLKCSDTRPCQRCIQKGFTCEGLLQQDLRLQDASDERRVDNVSHNTMPMDAHSNSDADSREIAQAPPADILMSQPNQSNLMTPIDAIQYAVDEVFHQQPDFQADPMMQTFDCSDPAETFVNSDASMGNFLKDVMNPVPSGNYDIADIMLPDVLDFTFDDFMDFPLSIFDRAGHNLQTRVGSMQPSSRGRSRGQSASGALTPNVRKAADIGYQAFKESMWLWTPSKEDRRTADQVVSQPSVMQEECTRLPGCRVPVILSNLAPSATKV